MSLNSDGVGLTMPVAPANSYSNNGGGFGWGGDGSWFIVLFLIFAIFGWNNGGFGGNNGSSGAVDNYVLASDFATLQRQIDSATSSLERKGDAIQNGLCDGFYAQNTTMLTGFANAELSRANAQSALMTQLNNMAMQSQNCCCETQRAIDGVNYNLATQSCDTRNTIQSATRDLLESNNANTRAILDKLTSQEMAAKDAQIAAQTQQIFGLQLAASQQAQNNYLVNQLRPCPVPAYPACPPVTQFNGLWSGFGANGNNCSCNCNSGCC